MLGNQARACSAVSLIGPGAKTDTAGATSAWTDISAYKGDVVIIASIGTVTSGNIAMKMESATDDSGSGKADIAGAAFTTVTTSNDPMIQKLVIPRIGSHPKFMRFLGTITTGPVDACVVMFANPTYV